MKTVSIKIRWAWIITCSLMVTSAFAVRPISQFQDLVAGRGERGFKDGSFTDSQFNNPVGMALDDDHHLLFVADRDNHRIRLIHLDDRNRVETLAGSAQDGNLDGPFSKATFDQPTWIVRVSGGNLVVYDMGSKLFRFLDMKRDEVSTLVPRDTAPPNLGEIAALGFDPGNNSLYFTQPNYGWLTKFDLTTLKSTLLLNNDPRIPNPFALCLDATNLYIADSDKNMVYSFPMGQTAGNGPVSNLQEVGPATQVISMTFSDGSLYALQSTSPYLISLKPARTVELVSVWGNSIESNPWSLGKYPPSFFRNQRLERVGFIGGNHDEKRFFLAGSGYQAVVTFWDYEYDKYKKFLSVTPDEINDLNYPPSKPSHTYRILLVGDSYIFSQSIAADASRWPADIEFSRMESPAKRLELMLNTEAALDDADLSFQVLCVGFEHGDDNPPFIWSYYKVPPIVEKYHVDLVLYVTAPAYHADYEAYFSQRMNSDHFPEGRLDPEYYLQPIEKRVPSGVAGDFYRFGLAQKLITNDPVSHQTQFSSFDKVIANPEAKKYLQSMVGRPLERLRQKLEDGKGLEKARFEICFIPNGDIMSNFRTEDFRSFWSGLSDQWNIPLLDLTDAFFTLRTTYFPLMCVEDNIHFAASGHELLAYLLARDLIQKKIVPFSTTRTSENHEQK